ncbi:MAG: lamin tail domain-containing protein [bacterium]
MIKQISVVAFVFACACGDWTECRQSSQCSTGEYCAQGDCVRFPTTTPSVAPSLNPTDNASAQVQSPVLSTDQPDPVPPHPCASATPPTIGALFINEVYANVASGIEGDANNDGQRDAYSDEFIELYNPSPATLTLEGTELYVGDDLKWKADEPFCLEAGRAFVVFARGTPNLAPDISVVAAQTRLSLANAGGKIRLVHDGLVLDEFVYAESPAESWTRQPELDPTGIPTPHTVCGTLFSPGRCCDGGLIENGCAPP